MRGDTWRVRTAGDRWLAPARDDYAADLLLNYALYIILLELDDTSSILNEGELNTFLIGDDLA